MEVYNLIFFLIAGLTFVLTFLLRKSCYISLKTESSEKPLIKSSPQEKKKTSKIKAHPQDPGEETIKIYVDKEIK